jgi:hypothetical protein
MSDDEFEEAMEELTSDISFDLGDFEERVDKKIEKFGEDYDISDMKFNDTEMLRALSRAIIALEDYNEIMAGLREEGVSKSYNLTILDKLQSMSSNLARDISKMQDDLKISRKTRQSDKGETAAEELARLKKLATKFYQKKMQYVYCENCRMLLSTTWFLYPEKNNKLSLECSRCGNKTTVTSPQLLEGKGTNHPEGFKF